MRGLAGWKASLHLGEDATRFVVVSRWERHHDILGLKRWVRAGLEIAEAKT